MPVVSLSALSFTDQKPVPRTVCQLDVESIFCNTEVPVGRLLKAADDSRKAKILTRTLNGSSA